MSGFTSTLCQAGGPPSQMYVLAQKLAKMNFVGTTAFFFATADALKVVPYFALGQFSTKGLGTSLVLLPLAMLTNMLGFWVVRSHAAGAFHKSTMADVRDLASNCVRTAACRDACAADKLRGLGYPWVGEKHQWRKRPTTPISTATRRISSR